MACRDLVMAALPTGYQHELSPQARWLYRTLRSAELAGLDPAEVIRTAVAARDLAGAQDIAAVLDARIRPRTAALLPQPQGSWASRVPRLPDPERHAYLAQIADMMDDRTRRLGQHTARTAPAWAVSALGPVPADPAAQHRWEQTAAPIAAYREMYGYDHPGDPIGPEPGRDSPDQRAAWHEAFAALGPVGGPDVRAMPDGRLWLLRGRYSAETAWAPRHVGRELRRSRLGGFDASLGAVRADAEADVARKAGDQHRAGRQETLAGSYRACVTCTGSGNRAWPRPWPTGRTGNTSPPRPATWPSPPIPNCAAATQTSRSTRCAPLNQSRPPAPDATARSPKPAPGSATSPHSTRHSARHSTSTSI